MESFSICALFSNEVPSAAAAQPLTDEPDPSALTEANSEFETIYERRYGRYRFWVPTILFALACGICMFFFSETGTAQLLVLCKGKATALGADPLRACFLVVPPIAAAGIGGAYMWIVADFIFRARRLDFAPADVLNATLRLAMAAALSYALAAMVKDDVGLPLAFAAGAFPLETVRAALRKFATDKLDLGVGIDDQWSDQIIALDSVDHPTADRLLGADVSTIAQLAYIDPVQLSMRTGLNFDFIVDLVSQALAWVYLDDRLDDLRSAGLRGAMEIRYFFEALAGKCGEAQKNLSLALLDVAPALPHDVTKEGQPTAYRKMTRAQFLNACDQIANDPNTVFLTEVWQAGHGSDGEATLPVGFDFSGTENTASPGV